jgi:hypothetical protein
VPTSNRHSAQVLLAAADRHGSVAYEVMYEKRIE